MRRNNIIISSYTLLYSLIIFILNKNMANNFAVFLLRFSILEVWNG